MPPKLKPGTPGFYSVMPPDLTGGPALPGLRAGPGARVRFSPSPSPRPPRWRSLGRKERILTRNSHSVSPVPCSIPQTEEILNTLDRTGFAPDDSAQPQATKRSEPTGQARLSDGARVLARAVHAPRVHPAGVTRKEPQPESRPVGASQHTFP